MRDFHLPGRSPVIATDGMAATSMPAASLAAVDVLRAGGNALDAAVAAVAVLGVIEPQSTGIGGDCFCLWAPATGGVVALNGSGRAPAASTPEHLAGLGVTALRPESAHVVTVPGAVSAWETLLAAHGTRGLDELLRPAIALAEDGFAVHARLAADWQPRRGPPALDGHGELPARRPRPVPRRPLPPARTRPHPARDRRGRRPRLLRGRGRRRHRRHPAPPRRRAHGRGPRRGRTGAEFVTPIHAPFAGHEVFQCPPNGTGLIVLMISGILDALERERGPAPDGPLGAIRLHRHAEAARLAYRDRNAFVADPAQVEVPVAHLLDPGYLASLAALIRDDVALQDLPRAGEAVLPAHRDTVYLCVVDRDGNACSLINSLFQSFGSCILAERSGVMLHNRGFGFRLEPGHPNCIAPDKRPMHTIIPGMLMDARGRAAMPYGVMGGHFQPMGQTLFLRNLLGHGMDVQEALDHPRLLPYGGRLELERGIPPDVAARLQAMGHDTFVQDAPHGGGQAIWIDRERGVLIGGSDPRKDGMALGY